MEAIFLKRTTNGYFLYAICGSDEELMAYKNHLGEAYREMHDLDRQLNPSSSQVRFLCQDDEDWVTNRQEEPVEHLKSKEELLVEEVTKKCGKAVPLFISRVYSGERGNLVFFSRGGYNIDLKHLAYLHPVFKEQGHHLWNIIDHCVGSDPRFKPGMWSKGRKTDNTLNSQIDKLPDYLKSKLLKALEVYDIPVAVHVHFSEVERKMKCAELDDLDNREKALHEDLEREMEHDRQSNWDKLGREELDSWGEEGYWNLE